jgi:hypothetical protein
MDKPKPHPFRPPLTQNGDGQRPRGDDESWDAYRKWLSRVSGKPRSRTPLDHSIYSWKGYQSWAEKVRQDWDPSDG